MQIGSRTPASIALANAVGIAAINRASGRISAAAVSSTPLTRNAPTAAGQPPATAPVDTSSAQPGVDHATAIGIRSHSPNGIEQATIPRHSASSPDAASARSAPTACSPARTSGNVLAKPTTEDTTPARIG